MLKPIKIFYDSDADTGGGSDNIEDKPLKDLTDDELKERIRKEEMASTDTDTDADIDTDTDTSTDTDTDTDTGADTDEKDEAGGAGTEGGELSDEELDEILESLNISGSGDATRGEVDVVTDKKEDISSPSGDENLPDYMKLTDEQLLEMKENSPVQYDKTVAKIARYELSEEEKTVAQKDEQERLLREAETHNTKLILKFAGKFGIDIKDTEQLRKFGSSETYAKVASIVDGFKPIDESGKYADDVFDKAFLIAFNEDIVEGAKRIGRSEAFKKIMGLGEMPEPRIGAKGSNEHLSTGKIDLDKIKKSNLRKLSREDLDAAVEEQLRQEMNE